MSERQTINVTGVREGTVGTANTAAIVHGGMGNLTHNKGAKNTAYNSNVGQMGDGGTATGTTFGASTPPLATDNSADWSSAKLLVEVRRAEVTDDALKKFEDNKITGSVFLDGDLEVLLKDLDITNIIDVRKLNGLRKKLEAK